MDALLQDLRYAFRQLAKSPGFAIVMILTLALGIGANTAIFGAVDAILLKPLPYPDDDRIVTLSQSDTRSGARDDAAPANFLDWRERSGSFEALAAADPYTKDYFGVDGPARLRTWQVTESFFDIFETEPLIGRTPRQEDYEPGAEPVVVLGYALWQSKFGRDPAMVGRTLVLDGVPTTVIGVMPPRFEFPPGRDMWTPRLLEGWESRVRASAFWQVVGKLKPDVSLEAAQAELDAIATQLATEYPATNADIGIAAVPLADRLVGQVRPALLLFLAAVALVLLIACVNVANLLLARTANRRHELAIRSVAGAERGRLIRQLVTESLVIALLGGALGLVIAAWGMSALQPLKPDGLPHVEMPSLDGRLVLFASCLVLGASLLCGLMPALHAAPSDLRGRLHSTTHSAPRAARRFRGALVVFELALAMVLLISAGLLIRSFVALLEVDRGYRTEKVLALTVQAWRYYPTPDQRELFVEQALERIGSLPGVAAAGVASSLPLAEDIGADLATFRIFGRPVEPSAAEPTAHTTVVTNGYFQALGIPLRNGRLFSSTDDAEAPLVVVINEAMSRRYWPGENPIGARVDFTFDGRSATTEVIGIVGDVRHALHEEPRSSFFVPHAQHSTGALHFTVRAVGEPTALVRAVQDQIWAMNPAMPFAGVATLDGLLDDSLRQRRLTLLLLAAFSLTALALAAVGTYGMLSYESSRRFHEIGIRVALGAQRDRVLGLVVGQGLRLSLLGIAVGGVLALIAARMLSGFLFGVSAFDPLTFIGIALLLISVAALASFVPAWRAARADPMAALRAQQ